MSSSIHLGKVSAAMFAGIGTVCFGGATATALDTDPVPDFRDSAKGVPRYSQDTFKGRFKSNLVNMSPLLLLGSSEDTLRGYQKDIKSALASGEALSVEKNADLWNKKVLVGKRRESEGGGERG